MFKKIARSVFPNLQFYHCLACKFARDNLMNNTETVWEIIFQIQHFIKDFSREFNFQTCGIFKSNIFHFIRAF